MSNDSSFNTTELTLKFLANNVYQDIMENRIVEERPSSEDCLFYNKRLLNMITDMLEGKYPTDDIKKGHLKYIDGLIEYMKIQDRSDIIQNEYTKQVSFSKYEETSEDKDEFNISLANKNMLNTKVDTKQPTLDNFILTKKVIIKEDVVHPVIKTINIKTESHKTKGITQKDS
jgi:hypothetical protein